MLFYDPSDPDPRFTDGGSWFSCSGTLVDETHVVTAGHCTYGIGNGFDTPSPEGSGGTDVWISFAEVPDFSILPPSSSFIPDPPGIPSDQNEDRYNAWTAALDTSTEWIRGTAYPHSDYAPGAFFLHDLGVLELDDPVTMGTYGKLPTQGLIDELYKANRTATYTPVGYGLEKSMPWGAEGGDRRNVATVKINSINGAYGLGKGIAVGFSSNKGKPHRGGTCFGDSGGPTFPNLEGLETTIITVTSFGIDPNCKAGGGGYRIDQPDDLAFLATFDLTP
jgi:hypothetical protein